MRDKRKEFKNFNIRVEGVISDFITSAPKHLEVIITNDSNGKTIGIHDGDRMFTIPFEPIEKYLK